MNKVQILAVATMLLASTILCQNLPNPAEILHPECNRDNIDNVERWYQFVEPGRASDQLKGYAGTVGIIGGGSEEIGSTYFAAITALKIGADKVIIFCYNTVLEPMRVMNPNILVYPILNVNADRVITLLAGVDVIVLGPGLEKDGHCMNAVIPKVVTHCKTESKPLIVDLDDYFITQAVMNNFMKFPYPGVIFTPNWQEFTKMYEFIKKPSTLGVLSIDYDKYGEYVYFLRKGCVDVGTTRNISATFALNKPLSSKRSYGQGSMLSGALATYFFRALKNLPIRSESKSGPMIRAAVASYAASRFMRINTNAVYQKTGRSIITSDLIDNIYETLRDNIE